MQSATYTVGHPQRDGRRYVDFAFVLDDGTRLRTGDRGPIAIPADARQRAALLDEMAAQIGADLEAEHNVGVSRDEAKRRAMENLTREISMLVDAGKLSQEDIDNSEIKLSEASRG